jgi:1-acyl-sn-glycerol-3-phosphate acyltransferase
LEETYQGPDYRAAVRGAWGLPDPLLHPDPNQPPRLYLWVVAILRWLLPRIFRFRVEGRENLPTEGPYIIASNHQAWYDPALLLVALPSPVPMVYSMARRDTVFNRGWKRAIVRRLGVFAIAPHEGELDLTGLASVYHVLSRGGRVLIFPEGRYSRGRRLRPLKTGIAHFALQAGVPIVPMAIDGLERFRLGARVTISIGEPVHPDPPTWWNPSRRVLTLVDNVRRAILTAFDRPPKPREERLPSRLRARLRALIRNLSPPPSGGVPAKKGGGPSEQQEGP